MKPPTLGDWFFLHLLSDLWGQFLVGIGGYCIGSSIATSRNRKELAELERKWDEETEALHRRVDFQLKAKGCEGLTEQEPHKEK